MISLDLQSYSLDISIPKEIKEVFPSPLMFYLFHEEDERNFFPVFTILDFQNEKLLCLDAFLEKNRTLCNIRRFNFIFSANH